MSSEQAEGVLHRVGLISNLGKNLLLFVVRNFHFLSLCSILAEYSLFISEIEETLNPVSNYT